MRERGSGIAVRRDQGAHGILDAPTITPGYRFSWLANFFSGPIYCGLESDPGLSRPELVVLFCLAHASGIPAAAICRATGRPKNSISRAIARLLAAGRIRRRTDAADRRAGLLGLTDEGRALDEALIPRFRARQAAMLAPLSAGERAALDRLLGKLVRRDDDWAAVF
ncbi:MarR family winged helix-turn-helix transcriptional regulator [Roseomonas sp. CCTCC AB2023176]|uniref:MarR family winged helix-turn-helix transcriptional regulator n=1 Tax=Roseomonas sp. CCTCC AB2023176 TaxID=3342640 RepID=UPI0035D8541C